MAGRRVRLYSTSHLHRMVDFVGTSGCFAFVAWYVDAGHRILHQPPPAQRISESVCRRERDVHRAKVVPSVSASIHRSYYRCHCPLTVRLLVDLVPLSFRSPAQLWYFRRTCSSPYHLYSLNWMHIFHPLSICKLPQSHRLWCRHTSNAVDTADWCWMLNIFLLQKKKINEIWWVFCTGKIPIKTDIIHKNTRNVAWNLLGKHHNIINKLINKFMFIINSCSCVKCLFFELILSNLLLSTNILAPHEISIT